MGNLIVNNQLIPNIANVAVTREGHSSHKEITNEGFILIASSSEYNKGIVRQRVTDLVTDNEYTFVYYTRKISTVFQSLLVFLCCSITK